MLPDGAAEVCEFAGENSFLMFATVQKRVLSRINLGDRTATSSAGRREDLTGLPASPSVFGIRADGTMIELGFSTAAAAEAAARELLSEGYATIEIIDHTRRKVVTSLYSDLAAP